MSFQYLHWLSGVGEALPFVWFWPLVWPHEIISQALLCVTTKANLSFLKQSRIMITQNILPYCILPNLMSELILEALCCVSICRFLIAYLASQATYPRVHTFLELRANSPSCPFVSVPLSSTEPSVSCRQILVRLLVVTYLFCCCLFLKNSLSLLL